MKEKNSNERKKKHTLMSMCVSHIFEKQDFLAVNNPENARSS